MPKSESKPDAPAPATKTARSKAAPKVKPAPAKSTTRRVDARSTNLAALADGVIDALTAAGGADYLLTIARDDPKTFCALLTRILPARAEARGEGGVTLRWADASPGPTGEEESGA